MVELKLNYNEFTEMSLEDAKRIVGEFNKESFLEDIGEEVNGTNYGVKVLNEGDWIDEGSISTEQILERCVSLMINGM